MADGSIINNYDFEDITDNQLGSWEMKVFRKGKLVNDKTKFTINNGEVSRKAGPCRLVQTFSALTKDQEYTILVSAQASSNIPGAKFVLLHSGGGPTKVAWTQIDGTNITEKANISAKEVKTTATFKPSTNKAVGIAVIFTSKLTKISSVNIAVGSPTDCVGAWSDYDECSEDCGGGTQTRTYSVTTPSNAGGAECDYTDGETQSQDCNTDDCEPGCTDYTNAPATLLVSGITDYGGYYDSTGHETDMNGTYTLRNIPTNGRPEWRKNSKSFRIWYSNNKWFFRYQAYTYDRKFQLNDNSLCPWEGSWTYQGDFNNNPMAPTPNAGTTLTSSKISKPSSNSSGNQGSAGESECPSSSELSTIYVSNDNSVDLGGTEGRANGTYNRETATRANKAYWVRNTNSSPYYGIRWYGNAHGGAWVIGNIGSSAANNFGTVKYSPYSYTNEDCFVNATWTHVAGTGGGQAATTFDISNTQPSSSNNSGNQGINPDNWPDEFFVVGHPHSAAINGSYLKQSTTTGGGTGGGTSFYIYSNGLYDLLCLPTEQSESGEPTTFKWGFNPTGSQDTPFYFGQADDESSSSALLPTDVTWNSNLVNKSGGTVDAPAFSIISEDTEDADIEAVREANEPTITKGEFTTTNAEVSGTVSMSNIDTWRIYVLCDSYIADTYSRSGLIEYQLGGKGSLSDYPVSFIIGKAYEYNSEVDFTIYFEGFREGTSSPMVEAYETGSVTPETSFVGNDDIIPYKLTENCKNAFKISADYLSGGSTPLLTNAMFNTTGETSEPLTWKGLSTPPYRGSNSHYPPRRLYRNGKTGDNRATIWFDINQFKWIISPKPYSTDTTWFIEQKTPFPSEQTTLAYKTAMESLGSTPFEYILTDVDNSEPSDVTEWQYTDENNLNVDVALTFQENVVQIAEPLPNTDCTELFHNKYLDFVGLDDTLDENGTNVLKYFTKGEAPVATGNYVTKGVEAEDTDHYFSFDGETTINKMFTPLISKSALESGDAPIGGYFGQSSSWPTKFNKSNYLLKKNTKYLLRLGTYRDYDGRPITIKFHKYNASKFSLTQVKIISVDGEDKPSADSFTGTVNVRSSVIFETTLQNWQLPALISFTIRKGIILSSLSLTPNDCSNTSDDKTKLSKVTSDNSPVNWTDAGKQIPGSDLKSFAIQKGNIIKKNKLNHILFRNKFSKDLQSGKQYEITLFNPTGLKYDVSFLSSDALVKWISVDGVDISNPKWTQTPIAVNKKVTFQTHYDTNQSSLPDEITIDIGGEILENFNFSEKTVWKPHHWMVINNNKIPSDIEKGVFNFGFMKNNGTLKPISFVDNKDGFAFQGKARGVPLTQKFIDGFKLASNQKYKIQIAKGGKGASNFSADISVLILDENLNPMPMKWHREGATTHINGETKEVGTFGAYENSDDSSTKLEKTSSVFEYASKGVSVSPSYFVIFVNPAVTLKSVSLRAVGTDAVVNKKTGMLGGYELKETS